MLVCCFFFRAVHHSIVTIFIKYTKGRLCADYLVRVFIQLSTVTKLSNGPIYLWVISLFFLFIMNSRIMTFFVAQFCIVTIQIHLMLVSLFFLQFYSNFSATYGTHIRSERTKYQIYESSNIKYHSIE